MARVSSFHSCSVTIVVDAAHYVTILSDHLHPRMQHFFPARRSVFQDDNSPVHRAHVVTVSFEEHKDEFMHLSQPSKLLELNLIVNCGDYL